MTRAERKPIKTNAMRLLEQRNVQYVAHEYSAALTSAIEVAQALGIPEGQVYKTLVLLTRERQPLLVMTPGGYDADPRRVAAAAGVKSVAMASKIEAERLTGLQTGGIGALALTNRNFDVWLDQRAETLPAIFVNGGRRGLSLALPVPDLIALTGARLADLAVPSSC